MLSQLTLPKPQTDEIALDYQQLYALGLKHVQNLASRVWTDYNVHDPGITTLELLCYALTDLSYRASLPIQDLLASEDYNAEAMQAQFFTAAEILPTRPLTLLDYRKLLIDLPGVKNAWVTPATLTYYANTVTGKLSAHKPSSAKPYVVDVNIAGLYEVTIELMEDASSNSVIEKVKQTLQANRNLCEDFVSVKVVESQCFLLCAELELTPDADVTRVKAEILFKVQQYLTPPIHKYTLSEMLEHKKVDGTTYTADEIFEGPLLKCGFIDNEELEKAELRSEIYLSDVVCIIMDIQGVQAVREIIINPDNTTTPLINKWIVFVESGKQPVLNLSRSRLVFYKRNMPILPNDTKMYDYYEERTTAANSLKTKTLVSYDFDIPLGTFRHLSEYYSFQNHFPVLYGLSEFGLNADEQRKALAYQLKAYLLFFDQIMANYVAQLSHVKELFSTDSYLERTYFYQAIDSFSNYEKIYKTKETEVDKIKTEVKNLLQANEEVDHQARRHRFLDHLIARFAERFHDFSYTLFDSKLEKAVQLKCEFLDHYPTLSSERSLAYNYTLQERLWKSKNVSGLEKRLASLLGISDYNRRDLSSGEEEGMYLIENILLRPAQTGDPLLPIHPDPSCTDCTELDPYSYRIHIILPAYAGRFKNVEFRHFAEAIIREETPAHILPKICWVSRTEMGELQESYQEWLSLKSGTNTEHRHEKLVNFINKLFTVKNTYPSQKLSECGGGENQLKFILGQSALGTIVKSETKDQ